MIFIFGPACSDQSAMVLGMHQMYVLSGFIIWEQASWDRVWRAKMLIHSSDQQS